MVKKQCCSVGPISKLPRNPRGQNLKFHLSWGIAQPVIMMSYNGATWRILSSWPQNTNTVYKSKDTVYRYCTNENKKAVLSQRWPRNTTYIWVPWKFPRLPETPSLTTPTALFPTFSWAFFLINPMNVPTKFEVRSFTRSWDNRGYPKNWAVPGYAHSPFSPTF